MCYYPRLIENPKYKPTKKNGGNIPPVHDKRVLYVPIGCQNCMECRKQKARSWQVRLLEDIRHHKNGKFITFTFSDQSIKKLAEEFPKLTGYNLDNAIATRATRLFLERWRRKYKKSLRHWLVTEIGHNGTENIHLHGIIWTDHKLTEVEERWQYGFVWKGKNQNGKIINYVNERTVNYITKYVHKVDLIHKTYKSIILTSAGIGAGYMKRTDWKNNKFNYLDTDETYRTRTGHKITLPIYWRNKIYTDQEREQLWIQRLNTETRYVGGVKIDMRRGNQHYLDALREAQKRNVELGYGDYKPDWELKEYEKTRRELMLLTRIANAKEKEKEEGKISQWTPIDNYWEWR